MENPIKMDDLGVPLFLETPIWSAIFVFDVTKLQDDSRMKLVASHEVGVYLKRLDVAEMGGVEPMELIMY